MHKETISPKLDSIIDCLYRVSAKAVIVQNHKLLLVQENEKWWSLPGGGVDHGETIAAALERELTEEIGVAKSEIQIDEQVLQVVIGQTIDNIPRIALLYKVEISADAIRKTDHVLGYDWFTAKDLSQLYLSPTVGSALELVRHVAS
jgi:8-oxo-dGTP diphosphatase